MSANCGSVFTGGVAEQVHSRILRVFVVVVVVVVVV